MIVRPLLQALDRLLPDPEPPLVIEIGDRAVAGARRSGRAVLERAERPLPRADGAGAGDAATDGLGTAVRELLHALSPLPGPHAAVLLPDAETRLAVFEFDRLPRRSRELRSAVEERFRKSLPFAIRSARIAYRAQAGGRRPSVLASAAPADYVARCERACEEAGLVPGYVGAAAVAALNLVADAGTTLLVKLGMRTMTMAAVEDGAVLLVRRIALPPDFAARPDSAVREIVSDLFPTLVYMEENLGKAAAQVLVAAPGSILGPALELLPREIAASVGPLVRAERPAGNCDAGLMGYIHG